MKFDNRYTWICVFSIYAKHVYTNFTTSTWHRCFAKIVKLCTDTDSLIYYIECDNVYNIMKCNINRFDTSDYAIDNAYCIPLYMRIVY